MLNTMICKQNGHGEERFRFSQERHFVMPVSEKQSIRDPEMSRSIV